MAKNGTAEEFGIDSNNVDTLEAIDPWNPKDIYNQYVKELNSVTYKTPDGFVVTTGGVDFTQPVKVDTVGDTAFKQQYPALPSTVQKSLTEVARTVQRRRRPGAGHHETADGQSVPERRRNRNRGRAERRQRRPGWWPADHRRSGLRDRRGRRPADPVRPAGPAAHPPGALGGQGLNNDGPEGRRLSRRPSAVIRDR
jgi:hypothetical protein